MLVDYSFAYSCTVADSSRDRRRVTVKNVLLLFFIKEFGGGIKVFCESELRNIKEVNKSV